MSTFLFKFKDQMLKLDAKQQPKVGTPGGPCNGCIFALRWCCADKVMREGGPDCAGDELIFVAADKATEEKLTMIKIAEVEGMSNASFGFKAQTGDVFWLKAVPEPVAQNACQGCIGADDLCVTAFRGLQRAGRRSCVDDHIIFAPADQATKDKVALIKIKLRLKR